MSVRSEKIVWYISASNKGLSANSVTRFVSRGVCVSSASRVSVVPSLLGIKNIKMRWTLRDGG